MLEAILFDMDGLLVDSEALSYEIIAELAAQKGFSLSKEQYCTLIGQSQEDGIRILDALCPGVGAREVYDRFQTRYITAVAAGRLRLKPGVRELLDACEARGIKKAVVSSNLETYVRTNLAAAGISGRFDAIVFDGMAEQAKPAPDLFLVGARLLGVRDRRACLVLEDSEAGIRAGHAAGMPVINIPDLIVPAAPVRALCLRCTGSLAEVAGYLDEL